MKIHMAESKLDYSYDARIRAIRETKMAQTQEKQQVVGAMDHDDHALILPPAERRKLVETISGSGMPITDVLLDGIEIIPNHENGSFYGARATGANYRRLLENHPTYIDPMSALAGGYMVNFLSYRAVDWKPEFSYEDLKPVRAKYQLEGAIGAKQHFCQDLAIGLAQGWGQIKERIDEGRQQHPESAEFYNGLADVVIGMQAWIANNAAEARRLAAAEVNASVRQNLLEMAEINERLVSEPPTTFREACQWMLWFQMAARMYNGSGSLGRLDVLLQPYYDAETQAGTLNDEEAIFYLACLFARDTAYLQIGGPDKDGRDVTTHLSYLILEATHRLKIPCNLAVAVAEGCDTGTLRKGVEILFEDKLGIPKFLGTDASIAGYCRNGYDLETARQRAYSGCHWSALPGREYTMNDCIKINIARVLDVAIHDMPTGWETAGSMQPLWEHLEDHFRAAVLGTAQSIDFQMAHMHEVFPELVLDLLCHGPIERGLDASYGGVDEYNICLDVAGFATAVDSLAAIEQRIIQERRLSWQELIESLDNDWAGREGELKRLMMKSVPHYGMGGTLADEYALRVSEMLTRLITEKTTPNGFKMIPGIFSWANTISMGKILGATPNGRPAGAPISHGANPDPGFRKDGAATALAASIAGVQPGHGNAAPMQIELDPMLSREEGGVDYVMNLILTHFRLGGTQINMNIMDSAKVLEAHRDPSLHPDLVVRVTGFSAYFASLSPAFRQLVVDRIIDEKSA